MHRSGILELPARMEQGRKSAGYWAKAKWSIKVAKPEQSLRRGAKSQNCKQNMEELCWMRNKPSEPVKKKGQVTEAKDKKQSPRHKATGKDHEDRFLGPEPT